MIKSVRLAIAQINCTVGDIGGNQKKIYDYITKAEDLGADIVSFPELAITGYPPEDLLLKRKFIEDNIAALKKTARCTGNIIAVVGFADALDNDIYNAAAVIHRGEIRGVYRKIHLPNYGVFDEKRYFKPGKNAYVFKMGDLVFGVNICEDIWHKDGPTHAQAESGASIIININSSPFHAGKSVEREDLIRDQAKVNGLAISYTNLIGGQDELVFDGQSMIVGQKGAVIARAGGFQEELLIADCAISVRNTGSPLRAITVTETPVIRDKPPVTNRVPETMEPIAEIYSALALGLKDYSKKNEFKKVVIGLSGGIDSSLVASLAADTLGSENVTGLFMPTRYSSSESEMDARALAKNLGIKFLNISIEHIFKLYLIALEPYFAGSPKNTTEENLQARIRGNIIMALSNKFGWLVLTTGNKSEMSTGYATLYGDMAGGFAVIKDVPKTMVYKLAKYRNSIKPVIPVSVLKKEPTAELRPNQKDSDNLPPYETLDPILKAYVEEDKAAAEIIIMGFDKEVVAKTISMVDNSEYKRRQSPPGIKITPKAFGRDRRMPITNKYR